MDVHIDVGRCHIEIKEVRNLHAGRHQTVERLGHGLMEEGVLHVAAIHKEVAVSTFPACRLWLTHETGNTTDERVDLNRQQILIQSFSEDVNDTLAHGSGRKVQQLLPIAE